MSFGIRFLSLCLSCHPLYKCDQDILELIFITYTFLPCLSPTNHQSFRSYETSCLPLVNGCFFMMFSRYLSSYTLFAHIFRLLPWIVNYKPRPLAVPPSRIYPPIQSRVSGWATIIIVEYHSRAVHCFRLQLLAGASNQVVNLCKPENSMVWYVTKRREHGNFVNYEKLFIKVNGCSHALTSAGKELFVNQKMVILVKLRILSVDSYILVCFFL